MLGLKARYVPPGLRGGLGGGSNCRETFVPCIYSVDNKKEKGIIKKYCKKYGINITELAVITRVSVPTLYAIDKNPDLLMEKIDCLIKMSRTGNKKEEIDLLLKEIVPTYKPYQNKVPGILW